MRDHNHIFQIRAKPLGNFRGSYCHLDIHRGGKLVDGMIVDRTAVMFERIREELRLGQTARVARGWELRGHYP